MPGEEENKMTTRPVWHGKPSVGSYVIIYGLLALIAIVILVTLEYYAGLSSGAKPIFPSSITISGIILPYPVELFTAIIIAVIFVIKLVQLAFIWATNTYDLLPDGLYVNQGLINLQNTLLSPMAFSDARLIRTWPMRLAGRGLIIVEANDGRRFYLRYIRNPLSVQAMIRSTLARPTVRTEK